MHQEEKQNDSGEENLTSTDWVLSAPYGYKSVLLLIVIAIFMGLSGKKIEIDDMFAEIFRASGYYLGINEQSQVANGLGVISESLFPIQLSESVETARIENFDENDLPLFSKVLEREKTVQVVDPATLQIVTKTTTVSVLYSPIGYLSHVFDKMIETFEIAVWATIFSVMLSLPLAYYSSTNYTPNKISYWLARGLVSLFRAVPELISAMFLVLAFGFGPSAGILALAFHSAGFLGKFYAEDIENADKGPQQALEAIGASKLSILRYAVLPQVLPQYVAYSMYVLDRNVRMATVIGIVGAGGIGQELKGRYDMFDYGHVMTILIAIFITVFLLDQIASYIRSKLI